MLANAKIFSDFNGWAYFLSELSSCFSKSSCFASINNWVLSSSFMLLTASIVGVGALFGDGAFLEDIDRWAFGLAIDKKSGVGPKGENC